MYLLDKQDIGNAGTDCHSPLFIQAHGKGKKSFFFEQKKKKKKKKIAQYIDRGIHRKHYATILTNGIDKDNKLLGGIADMSR
jgi:hypothetical protein